MTQLRAKGLKIEPAGTISQPFFDMEGKAIKVNREDVQVFEYSSAADASAQARLVSPDGGTVGTTAMSWLWTPHFFKKERLIVLYLGQNERVLKALESLLGQQFAGG